ncbi:KpsF/GutQ family protein [Prosthecochloris aestuarii DSM 271]|uniref:KpsF/GutQ family protein n=1 Tax=Prosthecochloris aestuarii (strain DSM 271 / SK 413) TaxID=290512 RepID=B4S4W3_PROA2|nr:KpsF/GutQ family sugar-phosphate isomerase [Prosthecochloris aestuarii]ACF45461.1 KpsF/GutQ family protein [Prosthecochloris aestuarii DSM 271]
MSSAQSIISSAKTILRQEAAAIENIAGLLRESFADAVFSMYNCKGKVIVSGMGKSGIIGQKIAATLASTGTTALFMHPADAAHGDLGVVNSGDIVICLSKSGLTEELNFILPALHHRGVTIIAIVGNPRSFLAEKANIVLDVSVCQEACPFDLAPTTSTTAMLAMGDALAISLMREKQFTPNDFALTHPKGSLGKQLTMKVADLMTSGKAVPLVTEEASVTDMILEMTSKRFGVSGVTNRDGKLSGIFTDGDLRRLIQRGVDFSSLSALDVMSPSPKTVSANALAKTSLEMLETYRITQLMVCDNDERPVGIIHIHDLVTQGL